MKIEIESAKIKDALNKLLTVVDKKSSRPILTYCLISTIEDALVLAATDLEVSAKITIPAHIKSHGSFCINAKNIFDILREMPNELISLEVDPSENVLKLACQDIHFSLLICNSDEFPSLTFKSANNEFELVSENVLNIINRTSHAISSDETRLYLNGIFLQEANSKLRAVATDGHRLALLDTEEYHSEHKNLFDGIIIPRKGVLEIKKIADSKLGKTLKFSVDESFLYVNDGESYYISIRLIARDFPKYQAVIPSKTAYNLTVDKEQFLTAVKRIRLMANEKSNGVRLSIHSKDMIVSANHPSLGDANEKIGINYEGNDFDIGFNAKYLLDTFAVLPDGDVELEFNNELSPVIIKSHKLPDYLGIVMPLKL